MWTEDNIVDGYYVVETSEDARQVVKVTGSDVENFLTDRDSRGYLAWCFNDGYKFLRRINIEDD